MDYQEIISDNCNNHSLISWWPKFAFHYTDVNNAVNILSTGRLYSRSIASRFNLMKNDNASRQVIDMTNLATISNVRFYFRPLTPTQYYNEGFKHPALRYDQDQNANVPVPVFFLFDLNKLLSLPNVRFSETSQAGHGTASYCGSEAFSNLNFDAIYNNRFEDFESTKANRQAEIIYPDMLEINSCLSHIVCRAEIERTTLLSLLRDKDKLAFEKYKNTIKVVKQNVFFRNGLYVDECSYGNHTLIVRFSDTYQCNRYAHNMMGKIGLTDLKSIRVEILIEWFNAKRNVYQKSIATTLDFFNPGTITVKGLIPIPGATGIGIRVYFEDKLMCYSTQTLTSELRPF